MSTQCVHGGMVNFTVLPQKGSQNNWHIWLSQAQSSHTWLYSQTKHADETLKCKYSATCSQQEAISVIFCLSHNENLRVPPHHDAFHDPGFHLSIFSRWLWQLHKWRGQRAAYCFNFSLCFLQCQLQCTSKSDDLMMCRSLKARVLLLKMETIKKL